MSGPFNISPGSTYRPEPEGVARSGNRVVHCKREPYDVYVGRPGRWGNPFVVVTEKDRMRILAKYRRWLEVEIAEGRLDPRELRGKVLGCWCAPKPCHGDILVELSERK